MDFKEKEYNEMIKITVQIRELIFDDADDCMKGAMVGDPVECLAFAKSWIQRKIEE